MSRPFWSLPPRFQTKHPQAPPFIAGPLILLICAYLVACLVALDNSIFPSSALKSFLGGGLFYAFVYFLLELLHAILFLFVVACAVKGCEAMINPKG